MRNKFNQVPKLKPKQKVGDTASNPAVVQQIAAKLQQGLALHNSGQLEQARVIYEEILKLNPTHYNSLQLLGAIATQTRQWTKALDLYASALTLNPQNPVVFYNQGIVLEELKRLDEALTSYDKAIELKQDYANAYLNRGNVLQELMQLDAALQSFERCIECKHDFAEAHYNRGNVLNKLKRLDESLLSYAQAIRYKNEYFEAYISLGNVFKELKRLEEALASYDKALEFRCDYAEIYSNRGAVLRELRRLDEALLSYDKAIEFNHEFVDAFYNRGNVLYELKRFDEALKSYDRVIELKPDYEYLFGNMLHTKMSLCDWQESEINVKKLSLRITEGQKSSSSFPVLALTDSLIIQRKVSEIWMNDKHPFNPSLGLLPKYQLKNKIRIGYYSADFREHAVSYLTAELFELHDKSRFEVIAFYSGPTDSSEMHKRVACAFDKFIYIRLISDKDVAQISRDMHIDIAIDLTGLTQYTRVGIFSFRAAPIQINYLGYSSTMGVDYYDYIIADKITIPEDKQKNYVEKIIYLPNCYLPHDSGQMISSHIYSKQEFGLPLDGFVFCCFNAAYKLNPTIFDSWMRILKATGSSVLWLSFQNDSAMANLSMEAEKRGINSNRIIFAQRTILIEEHLARHSLADLFLDTLPYNAHTTTLDALWARLPVLTCMGESFASRAAASALNAIELPELITTSQEKYEAMAIELATNPEKLKAVKEKLDRNRLTTALFDTPRFTKHIEAGYKQMYERYHADLPPDHIYIEA